jgi:TRAP-type C4-dicarboxylate transport system permease small subunit
MIAGLSNLVSRAMLVFSAALALLLSFVVCTDVAGRLLFDSPLRGTPEMVSTAIVIICFMQLPYAVSSGGMISVDVVVERLPVSAAALLRAVALLLGVLFFGFVMWGALEPLAHAWSAGEYEGEGALRVPVWPARTAVVVGTALGAFNYLLMALQEIARLWSGRASAPPPASQVPPGAI